MKRLILTIVCLMLVAPCFGGSLNLTGTQIYYGDIPNVVFQASFDATMTPEVGADVILTLERGDNATQSIDTGIKKFGAGAYNSGHNLSLIDPWTKTTYSNIATFSHDDDFTLSFWYYVTSYDVGVGGGVVVQMLPIVIYDAGNGDTLGFSDGDTVTHVGRSTETWQHIEIDCYDNVLYYFIDGVLVGNGNPPASTEMNEIIIGIESGNINVPFLIDDLRLMAGEALHTTDFDAPNHAYGIETKYINNKLKFSNDGKLNMSRN